MRSAAFQATSDRLVVGRIRRSLDEMDVSFEELRKVLTDSALDSSLVSEMKQRTVGQMGTRTQAIASDAKAIVLICEGRTFIAGADITEFGGGAQQAVGLHEVQAAMEDSPIPVIAAIHGTALGGGAAEVLNKFIAVDALNAVKVPGGQFGFVGLQMADEFPAE